MSEVFYESPWLNPHMQLEEQYCKRSLLLELHNRMVGYD
jgi:hypothetical protein